MKSAALDSADSGSQHSAVHSLHPLQKTWVALAIARAAAVIGFYLHAQTQGMQESVGALLLQLVSHASVTLALGAIFFVLFAWRPGLGTALLGTLSALALAIFTVADPIVYTLAGDHLTPALLAHYAGPQIFTSDYLWKPIRAHLLLSGAGVVGAALLVVGAVFTVRASLARQAELSWRALALGLGLAVLAAVVPETVEPPPELILARSVFGAQPTPSSEAIAELRAFVGLAPGERWLSDAFPLVHSRVAPAAPYLADIVVVSIESLRGGDLRFVSQRKDAIALPALEALASGGVIFSHFISNGFPSVEGFLSTGYSAFPHQQSRVVIEFQATRFDSLARRLSLLGYQTLRVEADPNPTEEGAWIDRSYDTLLARPPNAYWSERQMVDAIAAVIARNDASAVPAPLFIDLKTVHPHMPYEVADDEQQNERSFGSPDENYPRSLAYVDAQLGRLLEVLRARPRWAKTVVVVLGDHGNWRKLAESSPLPSDDMVWTGAVIAGGDPRLGAPRVVAEAASQVDIAPTLLSLVGDTRPSAALGRDLLANAEPPSAFALRPGGLRFDDAKGRTLLVDRRHLHGGRRTRSFSGESVLASDDARSGLELARLAATWSRLIEADRVWDPAFIGDLGRDHQREEGGYIDGLKPVTGWAFSSSGIRVLQVVVGDRVVSETLPQRIDRPDVAQVFSALPSGLTRASGFVIPFAGEGEPVVRVVRGDGTAFEIRKQR